MSTMSVTGRKLARVVIQGEALRRSQVRRAIRRQPDRPAGGRAARLGRDDAGDLPRCRVPTGSAGWKRFDADAAATAAPSSRSAGRATGATSIAAEVVRTRRATRASAQRGDVTVGRLAGGRI